MKASLPEPVLEIVDGQLPLAIEYDQVVAVTLVVAEEEVLAVFRTVVVPKVLPCDVDGRGRASS